MNGAGKPKIEARAHHSTLAFLSFTRRTVTRRANSLFYYACITSPFHAYGMFGQVNRNGSLGSDVFDSRSDSPHAVSTGHIVYFKLNHFFLSSLLIKPNNCRLNIPIVAMSTDTVVFAARCK